MEGCSHKDDDGFSLPTDIAQDPKHVNIMIQRPNAKLSDSPCLHRIPPSRSWRQGDPTSGVVMVEE